MTSAGSRPPYLHSVFALANPMMAILRHAIGLIEHKASRGRKFAAKGRRLQSCFVTL